MNLLKRTERLFLLAIALLTLAVAADAQKRIAAEGVVTDNGGVDGTAVFFKDLYTENGTSSGILTGPKGYFEVSGLTKDEYAWLIVESPAPPGYEKIPSMAWRLEELPAFQGIKLKVSKDPNFVYDLGNIRPTIVFRGVDIDISELFEEIAMRPLPEIGYELTFLDHPMVFSDVVRESYIDREKRAIRWALPKGNWSLTLSYKNGESIRTATYQLLAK
ncbi:MAG: hypothetical protein R2682_00555 [Pyrinomonadaceae bacterium]